MKRRREKGLDNFVIALALGLAAFVIWQAALRWPGHKGEPAAPATSAQPPTQRMATDYPLASARPASRPKASYASFEAVRSIPPIVISRTGRPTVRTKAPPPPKPAE